MRDGRDSLRGKGKLVSWVERVGERHRLGEGPGGVCAMGKGNGADTREEGGVHFWVPLGQ